MRKKAIAKLTSALFIGLTGVALSTQMDNTNSTNTVEAATQPSVVRINTGYGTVATPHVAASDAAGYNGQNLKNGTSWKVVGVSKDQAGNTWYNLGKNAWVKGSFIAAVTGPQVQAPSAATSAVQNVINVAKAQIGKPYAWGAKGPNAFDCSGLMYYAFANGAKRNIGGYTVAQESAGHTVAINALKAGDLVFWGSRGATYHVGLYLGNGQYLHAPAPGQSVKIQTISSYFMPSFGVRVL